MKRFIAIELDGWLFGKILAHFLIFISIIRVFFITILTFFMQYIKFHF